MGMITVQSNIDGIPGLTVLVPKVFEDNRGYLTETYNYPDIVKVGIDSVYIQDNEAYSRKGVLRGFYINHNHPQAKLIRVLNGVIYDVVVDLRKERPTYKNGTG